MIQIKLNVPDEEFGTIERVFKFKEYLSVNEVFMVGLPTQLLKIKLGDMQELVKDKKKLNKMKDIDPEVIFKYQLKLLNTLLIDDFDIGTLPMPILIELTKEPKLVRAIEYSFGQGIDIKTDDIPQEQKKN